MCMYTVDMMSYTCTLLPSHWLVGRSVVWDICDEIIIFVASSYSVDPPVRRVALSVDDDA